MSILINQISKDQVLTWLLSKPYIFHVKVNTDYLILNAEYWILNTEYWVLNTEYWILISFCDVPILKLQFGQHQSSPSVGLYVRLLPWGQSLVPRYYSKYSSFLHFRLTQQWCNRGLYCANFLFVCKLDGVGPVDNRPSHY